ncbi:hypothetical protein FRB97_001118 [Tulasnella sp. 331]|nr:hypothetical protein FRB97_001118 [Tulasnella sp. 331]
MIGILTLFFLFFLIPPVNPQIITNVHESMRRTASASASAPPPNATENDDALDDEQEQSRQAIFPGAFPTERSTTTPPLDSPSPSSSPPSPVSERIISSASPTAIRDEAPSLSALPERSLVRSPPLRLNIPPPAANPFASAAASLLPQQFSPPLSSDPHHYYNNTITSTTASSSAALAFDTPAIEHTNPLYGGQHDLSSDPALSSNGTLGDEFYFDDEGLGTLEKIWLFARTWLDFSHFSSAECSCPLSLRSDCTHTQRRVFIAKSLPNFLPDVTPHDAVEYVLPLLNSLGTDPEEAVREAFVSEIVPTLWWFYSHCQLIDGEVDSTPAPPYDQEGDGAEQSGLSHQAPQGEERSESLDSTRPPVSESSQGRGPPDEEQHAEAPLSLMDLSMGTDEAHHQSDLDDFQPEPPSSEHPFLPVQFFTPLLECLLLSPNTIITDTARAAVVELLRRVSSVNEDGTERSIEEDEIRDGGVDERPFGRAEKRILERELLMGVVIGVARLPESMVGVGAGMNIGGQEHGHQHEDVSIETLGEVEAEWGQDGEWGEERLDEGAGPKHYTQTEGEYWGSGPSAEVDVRRQEEALQHHLPGGSSTPHIDLAPLDLPSFPKDEELEERRGSGTFEHQQMPLLPPLSVDSATVTVMASTKQSHAVQHLEDEELTYLKATTVSLPPPEEPPSLSITTSKSHPLSSSPEQEASSFALDITSPRTPPNERSFSSIVIPPSPPSRPPSRLFIPSTPPPLIARSPLPPSAEPPRSPELRNVSLPLGTPIAIPVTPNPSTPMSPLGLGGPRSAIPLRLLEAAFIPVSSGGSSSSSTGGSRGGGLMGHEGSRGSLTSIIGLPSPSWMMSPSQSPPDSRRVSELKISKGDVGPTPSSSIQRVGLGFLPESPPAEEPSPSGLQVEIDEEEGWGPLDASPTKVNRRRPSLTPMQPSAMASSSNSPRSQSSASPPSPPSIQERRMSGESSHRRDVESQLLAPPIQSTGSSSGSSSSSGGERSDDPFGYQGSHHSRTVTPGESPRSSVEDLSSAFPERSSGHEEEEVVRPGPLSLVDLPTAVMQDAGPPEPLSLTDLPPGEVDESPTDVEGPVIVGEAVPMRPSGMAFPPSASFTSVPMFMPQPPTSSPATSSSDNTTASGRTLLSATSTETPPSAVSSDVIRTPEDDVDEEAADNGLVSASTDAGAQSFGEDWINPYFSSALVQPSEDVDEDVGEGADQFDTHEGRRPPFSRKTTQSSANESSNGSSSGHTATGTEREHSDHDRTPEMEQDQERFRQVEEEPSTLPAPAISPSEGITLEEVSSSAPSEHRIEGWNMATPSVPISPLPQESMEQAGQAAAITEYSQQETGGLKDTSSARPVVPSSTRASMGTEPSEAASSLRADASSSSSLPYTAPLASPSGDLPPQTIFERRRSSGRSSLPPETPPSLPFAAPLTTAAGEVPPPTIFQRRRSSATAGLLGLPPDYAPTLPSDPVRAGDSPYPSPPEYGSSSVSWDPSTTVVTTNLFSPSERTSRPPLVRLPSGGTMYQPIAPVQFEFPSSSEHDLMPAGETTPPLDLHSSQGHTPGFSSQGTGDHTTWQHHEGDTPDDGVEGEAGEDAAVGRVASMSLIAAVTAAGVVSEATKRIFAEEVARVGRDHVYWVRREAAYALGALAKVVPHEVLIDSMLPLYEAMTADDVWHVRQSALFALPGILVRLTAARRKDLALSQCRLLSHDTAKSVRAALLEVMGEVIYSFREDDGGPPNDLVDLFVGKNEQHEDATWTEPPDSATRMWGLVTPFKSDPSPVTPSGSDPPLRSLFESNVDPATFDPDHFRPDSSPPATAAGAYKRDPDRVLICAFNFPAVVAAMGASRWVELRLHYLGLTQHTAVKVRRTLAASIGEIARIIGESHAHRDLTGVWWELVHDDAADVREKIIGCLDMYVASLPTDDKQNVAVQLAALWDGTLVGWREREALAAQLGPLAEHLSPIGRAESVRTMMTKALMDPVAAVREAAVTSSPKFFQFLPTNVATAAKNDLFTLAASPSFRRRVTFVAVCQARVLARALLSDGCQETDYLDIFEALSHDPVIDVRIGLSRLIGILCEQSYLDPSTRPAPVTALIRVFAADSSPQVKSYVDFVAHSPAVLPAAFTPGSSPSGPPHYFGLFSRPPTRATLLTDSLEDLMHADTSDMDSDSENGSAIPLGSGSTRPSAGVPSTTTAIALTNNHDDNPFLHDLALPAP